MTRIISPTGPIRANAGEVIRIAVAGKVSGGQPPITYSQQWHVEGRPVSGETGETFTVREQDDRKRITCVTTATDAIGRVLVLAASNEIFVGQMQRGPSGTRPCPPVSKPVCPEPPELKATAGRAPNSTSKRDLSKPVASKEQIKREMRKATGGCRSCAERARRRRRNQGR